MAGKSVRGRVDVLPVWVIMTAGVMGACREEMRLCLQAAWAGGGAERGSGGTWGRLLWGLPAEGVDGVARIWGAG